MGKKAYFFLWRKVEGLCSVGHPKVRDSGAQHHTCGNPWGPVCI